LEIPDPGWGRLGGDGVVLSLRLALSTSTDLRDIVGYLHEAFGLSNQGMFCIQQSKACWHGSGAAGLIDSVINWRKRYKAVQLDYVHHSEDVCYVDRLRGGYVVLSTRQRIPRLDEEKEWLHSSELTIALPGVPLDSKPFLDLCRYTGNDMAEFEYVASRHRITRRLRKPIPLKVVGTVFQTSASEFSPTDRSVVGVIAKNPFCGKRSLPVELSDKEVPLHDLLGMELILCDLRDWHDVGDTIDTYVLQGFEAAFLHDGQLIRPFGTWKRILKRARPQTSNRLTETQLRSLVKSLDS
jgi:hypothetical protein